MNSVPLKTPISKSDTIVVLIAGMSGGARTARFQSLEDMVIAEGYACARVDLRNDGDDLQTKTLRQLRHDLDAVLDQIVAQGFTKVIGIGKSFGGGLLLTHSHQALIKKILWAPAFTYSASGTYQELLDRPLDDMPDLTELTFAGSDITQDIPVAIIHGSADTVVPLENSKRIAAALIGALIEIEGADHSFKSPEHELQLIAATKSAM